MPRLHLPNIPIVLMPSKASMASNQVLFRVPRFLNKIDIKNYLKSMYNLDAVKVDTVVPARRSVAHPRPDVFRRNPAITPFVWETMYKHAFVTLTDPFTMPVLPDEVQANLEKKKKQAESAIPPIKTQEQYMDRFHAIMKDRYPEGTEPETVVTMPDPLSEPLKNLTLDSLARPQGQAKRRLNPKPIFRRLPTPPRNSPTTQEEEATTAKI